MSNEGGSSISGVAVVIDVLRAFSFAAYAFDAGIERITLMEDLDETLQLAASIPGALAGKDGAPEAGFELFNSPGQVLERSDLGGRRLVHRTSAGTIGAVAAKSASHLYCASFVVAAATIDQLRKLDPPSVTFVITGDGGTAEEDLACADYLAACLSGESPDPAPFLRRVTSAGQRLLRAVERGYTGVHPDDLALCSEIDRFNFAMEAHERGGRLELQPI